MSLEASSGHKIFFEIVLATTTPRPAGGGRDCQDNWDTCATVTQFCAVGGIKRNCKATCGLCW